jgi:hypothetical protein
MAKGIGRRSARRIRGYPRKVATRKVAKRASRVRKNMFMDQQKLDVARRVLGVETETEAIDQALDLVAFREELANGFAAVRRSGGIEDVFEDEPSRP